MKHIKLFEQFEEDSWWEEESPFDVIKDLKIIEIGGGYYYILKRRLNDNIILFDDDTSIYSPDIFNLNPEVHENSIIRICHPTNTPKQYLYKDLPKEIKDRLVI